MALNGLLIKRLRCQTVLHNTVFYSTMLRYQIWYHVWYHISYIFSKTL